MKVNVVRLQLFLNEKEEWITAFDTCETKDEYEEREDRYIKTKGRLDMIPKCVEVRKTYAGYICISGFSDKPSQNDLDIMEKCMKSILKKHIKKELEMAKNKADNQLKALEKN